MIAAAALGAGLPALSAQRPEGALPPVPPIHGPLQLTVAYPAAGARVDARDSIFLFGTAGDGNARVMVAGQRASVAPNGAWIAWIGIPPDSAFLVSITAVRGSDSTSLMLPLSHTGWVRESGAWVDRASLQPVGDVRLPADSALALTLRAAPGASVRLLIGHTTIGFVADSIPDPVPTGIRDFDRDERNLRRPVRGDQYVGMLPPSVGVPLSDLLANAASRPVPAVLEVAWHGDTTRLPWPLGVGRITQAESVVLDDDPAQRGGTDQLTIGRAVPGGTYTWFLPRGTRTRADMRIGDEIRLRLAQDAIAWVPIADVHPLPAPLAARNAVMGSLTLRADTDGATLRIPLTRPVPVSVEEAERGLTLTLYGAVSDANWTRYGADQQFVRTLTWRQQTADRVALVATLDRPLWGWRVSVDGTDLILRLRRPPLINPARPLAGRHIVIDPGHPPGGACGPTGLCEPAANLAVARLVRDQLVFGGARVTLTRDSDGPVDLWPRVALADSLDTDLLVSIHDNALPDGVNPFTNNGSSTFFNHLPSLPLARAIQRRLVQSLALRDLGVARGDLALVRPTWYPAVLTEGLFLMFPDQEAALRSHDGQQQYAAAIVAGITDFLHQVAANPP